MRVRSLLPAYGFWVLNTGCGVWWWYCHQLSHLTGPIHFNWFWVFVVYCPLEGPNSFVWLCVLPSCVDMHQPQCSFGGGHTILGVCPFRPPYLKQFLVASIRWPWGSRYPPVSTSHLTESVLGLQLHTNSSASHGFWASKFKSSFLWSAVTLPHLPSTLHLHFQCCRLNSGSRASQSKPGKPPVSELYTRPTFVNWFWFFWWERRR